MTRVSCRPDRRAARALAAYALVLSTCVACDVRVGEQGVSMGVSAGRAEEEWSRTYSLPPAGRFEVVSFGGPVGVRRGDGREVQVRIVREARASSDDAARAALQRVEIVEEAHTDRVAIEVRQVQGADGARRGRRQGVTVRVDVTVPDGLTTSIRTMNGPIRVENVNGRIEVSGSNGPFGASGVSGGMSASIVNGPVEVDIESLEQPTDLTVVNGALRLGLPADARATLSATVINGRVEIDDSFRMSDTAGSGSSIAGQHRVGGTINGGGPAITMQVTNGSVRITPRAATPVSGPGT